MKDGRALLREWIKRMGLNQQKAAAHLGIHHTYLSQMLNGHRAPGRRNAVLIEQRTGVPVETWAPTGVGKPEVDEPVGAANTNNDKA